MNDMNDDELRARFARLRDADRGNVPPFGTLLERAEVRVRSVPRTRTLAPVWLAAAAVVVVATGVVLRRSNDRDRSSAPAATTISNWKSPTASLLRVSGRDLLAPPSILSSTLDGALRSPVKPKGDSR